MNKNSLIVFTVLLVAFGIRMYPAITKPPVLDELHQIALTEKISLDLSDLRVPAADPSFAHSFLSIFTAKLGIVFFGDTPGAARSFFILLGTLSIFFVYRTVYEQLDKRMALLVLILLAIDQFHIGQSSQVRGEALLLFFAATAVFYFFKALNSDKRWIYLSGISVGGIYLSKEEAAVPLIAAFILFAVIKKEYRCWFRIKEFYIAILLMMLTIGPYVLWCIRNKFINYGTVDIGFGISMRSLYLYFAEMITWLNELNILNVRGATSNEFPFIHWVSGVLIFAGFFYSIKKGVQKNNLIFFSIIMFVITAVWATILDPSFIDSHHRASLTIFPGIIMAAYMLMELVRQNKQVQFAVAALIGYFILRAGHFISLPEHCYAVSNKDLCSFYYQRAVEYKKDGNFDLSMQRAKWIMKRCHDQEVLNETDHLLKGTIRPSLIMSREVYCR
jgi:hypothetical protein